MKPISLVLLIFLIGCNSTEKNKTEESVDSASAIKPVVFRPSNINDQLKYNRAMEALIWGMPAVNFDLMYRAAVRDAKAGYNSIVYWSKLQDWHIQTLTPNPDVLYFTSFFNLKESGPMVLEIPPAVGGIINGTVMDCWQSALEDVGIAGVDKGKGGKYFITPPGYKDKIPAGYILMPSDTYLGYFLLRSMLSKSSSDSEVVKAVSYGKQIKFYPYSQKANQQATAFIDMQGKLYDATIPYDLRFYQSLDRMIQIEPWLLRDKAMIDQLKYIGIEKGKAFDPDSGNREILNAAAKDAQVWIGDYYERALPPYFEGAHWGFPVVPGLMEAMGNFFLNDTNAYMADARGLAYSYAYFSPKHPGAGQYYLITIRDKGGNFFDCNKSYHLHVPPKAPVNQYWSVTVYDRETHGLIRNAKVLSRSSQSKGLNLNADGSVDIYFGKSVPAGKENNRIETGTGKNFEVMFRFYGPEKPLFDKSWKLPDIEEVK